MRKCGKYCGVGQATDDEYGACALHVE
jgi:hypothetical protein